MLSSRSHALEPRSICFRGFTGTSLSLFCTVMMLEQRNILDKLGRRLASPLTLIRFAEKALGSPSRSKSCRTQCRHNRYFGFRQGGLPWKKNKQGPWDGSKILVVETPSYSDSSSLTVGKDG